MSGNPHHKAYKRGEKLGAELVHFVETELGPDEDAVAHALRGAYNRLDIRTRLLRGEDPWPIEAPEDQDRSN